MVNAAHREIAGVGKLRLPANPRTLAPSHRLWLQVAFDAGSYLFHICETKGLRPKPCGSQRPPGARAQP